MKILDVGCGRIDSGNSADIIHDLEIFPYPIKTNSFDKIYTRHCLEHLEHFEKTMDEFYRIIKKDGLIEIIVPFYASPSAHLPTHKKYFSYRSFDLFDHKEDERWTMDAKAHFKIIETKYHFYAKAVKSEQKLINKIAYTLPEIIANKFPLFYQRFFGNIFPAYELKFMLKAIKK
ncbi:MAG: methyltransferase domain-containing protein [Candidatus Diapherotrites archaeon]|nr:methyltransferase domain-containing protein [Candidatus Diapherotrites archaeon]